MISQKIIKIATDTRYSGLNNIFTHRSSIKNSLCGDKIKIEVITKNTKISSMRYETESCILCEASAMGVPSIFPKTGGISEFFPENYPLSFDQFNYESLKEKLKLILTIENLNQIGIANKQFINNYLENTKLLNKFERLINGQ